MAERRCDKVMSATDSDNVMEERREKMVSPSGGEPTLRTAHFLIPSVRATDGPVFDLPPNAFSSSLSESNFFESSTKSALKLNFPGWRNPQKDWKTWVDHMCSLHQSLWKKAGIFDAVMNSTYRVIRNDDLILSFGERWCPETSTFVFPWGEATLTLEDVMILGGYAVAGEPVFSYLDTEELAVIEKKLIFARTELIRTKSKKASQSLWLVKFMDSGSEIEHEAFLTFWLSRFVFPTKSQSDNIERHLMPIAVHLARGTKIALAPAVLADLYTNLGELKGALVDSKRLHNCNKQGKISELSISAPFQLVQIWVWERFPKLQPKPIALGQGQPRFAVWDELRMDDIGDVRLAIDGADKHFHWRPYAMGFNSLLPCTIYKEREQRVLVDSDMDEDLEVLVRCLRVSEVAGIDPDCIVQYLPHRVAMQFGIDQDLPGHVGRANSNQSIAWENYTRTIRDEWVYIPSRLFDADVTTRYRDWWKKSMSTHCGGTKAFVTGVNSKNDAQTSSSLPRKCNMVRESGSEPKNARANQVRHTNSGKGVLLNSAEQKSNNNASVTPGFLAKPNTVGTKDSEDKDVQAKRMRKVTGGEGVKLTASEYKTAILNRMTPKSSGKEVLEISEAKKSHNDALVPPIFPPKCNTMGTRDDLEDKEGQRPVKRLRGQSDRKDKNGVNKLTGSAYKRLFASQVSCKSLGTRMLPTSARKKLDNAALLDKAQKDSQLEIPISSIEETITVQNKQPLENKLDNEKEKGSSKTLLGHQTESRPGVNSMGRFIDRGSSHKFAGTENQPLCTLPLNPKLPISAKGTNGAEAVSHKTFSIHRGNVESCSVRAFEDPAMKLKARIRFLRRIIVGYKGGQ
ncbi:hypothetical protein ACH5RR_027906 [Cinchona calisaya]|uniref:Aminotransferase-like plant mobile domain-containing protein n=1 Tax=Cinchona calisaya TaxID=153742 RepID=A0ABD2YM79_9GENT